MLNIISNQFSFFDENKKIIPNVLSVEINEEGKFSTITYFEDGVEHKLDSSKYTFTNLILSIPGLGYARCDDIITLERYREKTKRYYLNFGWHENISNQKLFTWFLTPVELGNDEKVTHKTLYYEDLCNIVAVEHIAAGILPEEQED